ncbi:MAG: damage-inducible protein DinB [Acidobacteria bacterium]|nr:damage-inducible protein DinB [Acidobacteriota bacterium]
MPDAHDPLLEALLDSWQRNNTILVNLLRLVPDVAMDARPTAGSPSVAGLFMHMHYVRLIFVAEDAPDFARPLPDGEWRAERDRDRIATMLNESAAAVAGAVRSRLVSGREMARHYDHPILMLQHLVWHEGYHHGQIKLTLKLAGQPVTDGEAGPGTWAIWMEKTRTL